MAEEENQQKNLVKELQDESSTSALGSNEHLSGKLSWPELVGLTAEEAERKINEETPDLKIQVVPAHTFVTTEFQPNRVRIFVDVFGKVASPPRIG